MKNILSLILLFTALLVNAQVDLENGLIARYRFNGDATDATSNHYDGTFHRNATTNGFLKLDDNTSDYRHSHR